ncbi:MAG: ADP-ribosylglycohydrolase family protein [Candidatus Absconditabacterales bacterium]
MEKNTQGSLSSQQLKNKIISGLLGGAIGDALGAPVEMITQEQIFAKHGRVQDYLPIKDNMFFKKHGFESDEGGRITDDTILTFALIKSYNELGRLDLADIFKKHQEEYDKFPYGFGGATRFGMKNIKDGIPLEKSGQKDAAGNGVVMKQFPLAAIAAVKNISDEEMAELINAYTRATHDSDIAVVASIVHHKFLKELLKTESKKLNKKVLLQQIIDFITLYEKKYPQAENKISSMLSRLSAFVDEKSNNISLSDQEIIEHFGRGKIEENNPKNIFKSGYVIFTLGIVYALFLRNGHFEGLIDAVNIGGDTDSYAAIMGNMIGAYQGIEYQEKYINGLQKKEEIIADVNKFIDVLFDQ